MASYNELNALIDAYINRNGVQAITGQILNGVLKAMVEQLGRGYTIMGAAIPTTDPGTPDGPECYFASETGTYTDFDGLQVVPGELALLCYTPSDGWTKATIYEGFREVGATIDGNVGTPSVGVSYADGVLSFDFHNMKGNPGQNGQDGAAAGFGTIGADIAGGVGTPAVSVESSGQATAKNLQFHFTNLKGETGVTSVVATVDNTTGTPSCAVSLVGQELHLDFSGLKGAQGNTGSSVDYPFEIVNNLTTNDATKGLSAAQGVVLDGKVSQLEAKVTYFGKPLNEVTGVGTQDISLFQPIPSYPDFKVEQLPDTASPFAGILTKYTKVTLDAGGRYCAEPRDSRDGYPTRVTISFWINEDEYADWNTNWTDYFDFNVVTYTPSFISATMRMYIKNILAQTLGETKNWLSLGAYSTRVAQIGKWHQIVVYKDFSVSWTKWSMQFNFGNHANKTFSIVNPQIVFGNDTIPVGVVVLKDVADVALPYPVDNYSASKKINYLLGENADKSSSISTLESEVDDIQNVIEPLVREKTNVLDYYKASESVFIESQFNAQNFLRSYIGWSKSENHGSFNGNGLFGFAAMQFVANNQATTIYSPTDDIAPANYNGTYIGGNHGCSDVRKITVQGHGKTYADIGSKWSNGSKNFYIINIPDENTIWMLGENEAVYPKWSFPKVASGDTLTHISGATHTGSMSVSASETQQMMPAVDIVSRRAFVDGKEITDIPDKYSFAEFVLVEIYDVMNPASVLDKIIDGVGTFTENPMFYNLGAEYVARHTLTYRFTSSYQCFIETNISFYQNVDFGYFALTQFGAMPNNPKVYIPKSLPVGDMDYRQFQNLPSVAANFPESAWENPALPIDRAIEKNGTIAAEIGFLFDYGDAGVNRKDNITIAGQIAATGKLYPHFVDKPVQMPAGSGFNGVAMRRYIDLADIDKNGVLAIQQFEYGGKYYIYADYNLAGTYKISIPDKWRGKQVSVFEKSDNVALMTGLANDELLVMVKTASPMYGYLVAQIK